MVVLLVRHMAGGATYGGVVDELYLGSRGSVSGRGGHGRDHPVVNAQRVVAVRLRTYRYHRRVGGKGPVVAAEAFYRGSVERRGLVRESRAQTRK